jgi:hypothetical protein
MTPPGSSGSPGHDRAREVRCPLPVGERHSSQDEDVPRHCCPPAVVAGVWGDRPAHSIRSGGLQRRNILFGDSHAPPGATRGVSPVIEPGHHRRTCPHGGRLCGRFERRHRASAYSPGLRWSRTAGGPWTSSSGATTLWPASGTAAPATAGQTISLFYRTLWQWTGSPPGAYTLPVNLTLTSP